MSDLLRCSLQSSNLRLEIPINLGLLPSYVLAYELSPAPLPLELCFAVQNHRECLAFPVDIGDPLDALRLGVALPGVRVDDHAVTLRSRAEPTVRVSHHIREGARPVVSPDVPPHEFFIAVDAVQLSLGPDIGG